MPAKDCRQNAAASAWLTSKIFYWRGPRASSAIKCGLKCRADEWRKIHGPKEQRTKEQRTKGPRTKGQIGVVERELLCHPRPDMGDLLPDRGAGSCQAEPRRPVSQTTREDQYVRGPVSAKSGSTLTARTIGKLTALARAIRRRAARIMPQGTHGLLKVGRRDAGVAYACTDTVAPAVSFRVAAAIRISIASPSTSVACTVLPAMRIATDRPRQHTQNDRLRHWAGSFGAIPSVSAPDHHVDGHGSLGVGGEVQRVQPVEARELLIDPGRRIGAD